MPDDVVDTGNIIFSINTDNSPPPDEWFITKALSSGQAVWSVNIVGAITCTGAMRRSDGVAITFRHTVAGAGDLLRFRKTGADLLQVNDIAAGEVRFWLSAGTASDLWFYARGHIDFRLDRAGGGTRSFIVRNAADNTVLSLSDSGEWQVRLTNVNTSRSAWEMDHFGSYVRCFLGIGANGTSSRRGGILVKARTAGSQPGVIALEREDGAVRYLWADTSGRLRISQSLANVDAGTGVIVGNQS